MAKRNKSKLKKRKQKQLKKAFKHSENQLLENSYLPPYKEPYEGDSYTGKKLEEGNKAYQKALDKVYGGTVIPLANYINLKSILPHRCTECGKVFFGKPGWLLTRENQKHVCGVDTGRNEVKQKRKQLSESEKLELCEQAKKGVSIPKLVKHFDISRYKVNKYLKEAGVKR